MFYDENIDDKEIAIWFLGQAGYFIKSGETTIMIDPYLTDSVGKRSPLYTRRYEFPINPADMYADIIIITHDHQDHLDDETINLYGVGKDTLYIAPHLTAKHLLNLGIKKEKVCVIDCGESKLVGDLVVTGMFALGTDYASIDTTGYHIKFKNGKSVYHTADTQWCDLLTMPRIEIDVLLTSINGKLGNMNVTQSALLAKALDVKIAIPNHYDVMELNAENPEVFRVECDKLGIKDRCVILPLLEKFLY